MVLVHFCLISSNIQIFPGGGYRRQQIVKSIRNFCFANQVLYLVGNFQLVKSIVLSGGECFRRCKIVKSTNEIGLCYFLGNVI